MFVKVCELYEIMYVCVCFWTQWDSKEQNLVVLKEDVVPVL